jgi:hypothetical protein
MCECHKELRKDCYACEDGDQLDNTERNGSVAPDPAHTQKRAPHCMNGLTAVRVHGRAHFNRPHLQVKSFQSSRPRGVELAREPHIAHRDPREGGARYEETVIGTKKALSRRNACLQEIWNTGVRRQLTTTTSARSGCGDPWSTSRLPR